MALVEKKSPRRPMRPAAQKPPIAEKRWFRPERMGQPIVSDQTKADRPNRLSKKPAGHSKQHFGDQHGNKAWPKSQDQGRKTDRRDPKREFASRGHV
jgi:hypothetical protein